MLNTLVVVAIVVILIIIVFRHLGSFRENINVISYVWKFAKTKDTRNVLIIKSIFILQILFYFYGKIQEKSNWKEKRKKKLQN